MSDISGGLRLALVARAKAHYPDALPYHNWEHARDVMTHAESLAGQSDNPEIKGKRNLLVVAAAWHDADYAIEGLGQFDSKEERSADLVARKLVELTEEDRQLVAGGIIDTTVDKWPKDNLFGAALHFADVGYFSALPEYFMRRLVLMHEEWGSPARSVTVERTVKFGQVIIKEAEQTMPHILPSFASNAWISSVESNLAYLQSNFS